VTSGESFANVKRWLHEIEQNCDVVNRVLGMLILNNLGRSYLLWVFNTVMSMLKLLITVKTCIVADRSQNCHI